MLSASSAVSGNACLHFKFVSLFEKKIFKWIQMVFHLNLNIFRLNTRLVRQFQRNKVHLVHWWIKEEDLPGTNQYWFFRTGNSKLFFHFQMLTATKLSFSIKITSPT